MLIAKKAIDHLVIIFLPKLQLGCASILPKYDLSDRIKGLASRAFKSEDSDPSLDKLLKALLETIATTYLIHAGRTALAVTSKKNMKEMEISAGRVES